METMMIASLESSIGVRVIMHGFFFTCTIQLGLGWGEPGVGPDSHQACLPMCVRPGGLQDNISPPLLSPGIRGKLQGKEASLPILLPSHRPQRGHARVDIMKNIKHLVFVFISLYVLAVKKMLTFSPRTLGGDLVLTEVGRRPSCDPRAMECVCICVMSTSFYQKCLTARCFTLLLRHSIVHRHLSNSVLSIQFHIYLTFMLCHLPLKTLWMTQEHLALGR